MLLYLYAWSFPERFIDAPLMGWRAKPRLEMKLQASAPPPAIMALHALSTTPMQAPRKPKFTVHWVRLQHTISLSEDKSPSPLDQKTEAKVWNSVIPAEHLWTIWSGSSLLGTSHVAHVIWNNLSKDVHRHATLESVRATAVFQGKADVSEPSKTFSIIQNQCKAWAFHSVVSICL